MLRKLAKLVFHPNGWRGANSMEFKTTLAVGMIAVASLAQAQNITSRKGEMSYTYVYGAGGDSHSDSYSNVKTAILGSDFDDAFFTGSTSGVLPGGTPYAAGVGTNQHYEYAVTGPTSSFSSISASGSTTVTTTTSGAGTAQMLSSNPGNEQVIEFTLDSSVDYTLSGMIETSLTNAGTANYVDLRRFDGITWQIVYTSIFLPNQQGTIASAGTLTAGQYRLGSGIALNAFGNQNESGSYNYQFDVVPEPATCLLAIPALALLRKKRK